MKHPYQIVIVNKAGTHLFTSVKNTVQVFELASGKKVGEWIDDISPDQVTHQNTQISKKKGEPIMSQPIYNHIRSLLLTGNEEYLVGTTDSDKSTIIFHVDFTGENCLTLSKRQVLAKRPCSISFDAGNENVVVADKFGDVYSIPIDTNEPVPEKELAPILGHVSMLSDVLVTSYKGKQFIITGDRDEHIRISNYPKSYVIKNFLFGHREFVSDLYVSEHDPSVLISGGGDDFICLWHWFDNELLTKVELRDLVEEYLHDGHLPPARFLTEDSKKEISIAKISTLKTDDSYFLIVLVENTRCLLVFEINDDFTVTHNQTITIDNSIVDFSIDESNKRIIASVDTESSQLFEAFKYEQGKFSIDSSLEQSFKSVTDANPFDVESKSDFQQLYYINSMRKRSEH
ncbi:uncharacterized protein SPAPADRAFT_63667 [Spathaspora passalidarum NRRL Y-27907]|uniref:Uncharacterized protein n=1 Tax=Spathaspora passalidarum (strain NRRL Y-27907 / 11-Y1) TaxID=619300 RepID=G3AUW0_SPAPN|nr:uncharacterized protein SPAPADRAFT_63667 [Spathaspora passalidarum NRRL Y-27907]EGW30051.1 hypothetical protein SPAPADRAFT_63667 [Spathaspora passalidarum NRRL Y-27907]